MALMGRPDFILTPHIAWAGQEAIQALSDQLIHNIEAWAAGVPVVQPRAGAFPELVEMTGGSIIYDNNTAAALADAAHPFERLHHAPVTLAPRHRVQQQRQLDVLVRRQHQHQVVQLKHVPDVLGAPRGQLVAAQ